MKALFGPSPKIDLEFEGEADRSKIKAPDGSKLCLLKASEAVAGTVTITLPDGLKKFDHTGMTAELIGQIELNSDRGNHYVFLSMARELAPAGTVRETRKIEFVFDGTDKNHDTYTGINVKLRYFVRVRISRSYGTKIQKEYDFAVQNVTPTPKLEDNPALKMEVGIEDCLHIEFEYERSKYAIDEVITGKIDFLLVRIKIKHMEMQILKKESSGAGPQVITENDVIAQFEIMDGAPVKGETIPVRIFLKPLALKSKVTPTMLAVHKKFNVKYFLNLVLVDEEDRRYFKQQEVILYRDKSELKRRIKLEC